MPVLNLKPTHKIITNYYKAVAESGQLSLLGPAAFSLCRGGEADRIDE